MGDRTAVGVGGSWAQVRDLARWLGRSDDPLVRDALAGLYASRRITELVWQRATVSSHGGAPGPEASIGKLRWTNDLTRTSEIVSTLLGPRLVAHSGEWGTFSWSAHVLGAPGYRIAGGSDEIQRNIIGEPVLGLPPSTGSIETPVEGGSAMTGASTAPIQSGTPRMMGRRALVTGGASGIGRASALRLAADGASVAVVDVRQRAAEPVAAEATAAGGHAIASRATSATRRRGSRNSGCRRGLRRVGHGGRARASRRRARPTPWPWPTGSSSST